ncbi:COP9 signalosome complex subunit 2, partial [Aphelenchoides avenae]
MEDYSYADYSSESDVDLGLEEEYEAAKLLAAEGKVVDAIAALKNILELDVDKSRWGFKACKRLVKLAMHP